MGVRQGGHVVKHVAAGKVLLHIISTDLAGKESEKETKKSFIAAQRGAIR